MVSSRHSVFIKSKDKQVLFGQRFKDCSGQLWELVSQNDLNVPYFVRVNGNWVGKTLFTVPELERRLEGIVP